MAQPTDFARACTQTARNLRRLPAEIRRQLGRRVRDEIAAPLAAKIAAGWAGPYAPILSAGTKARVSADPKVSIGGASPKGRGGAGPRSLVFGTEFGGGGRTSIVAAHTRQGYEVAAHRRHTTDQFRATGGQHVVFGTVSEQMPVIVEDLTTIVGDTFEQVVTSG